MGGAVSAGEDNDELIDNLVEAEYIKTPHVERIFRAVDRGDYYLEGCKENAYRDLAWKHGNIHLSAPCIYSEVMESLKLKPGMSFLNLGSGTGYLSTMAGLVLGAYGTNHGVELHADVVEYAQVKLDEFQSSSPALDKYEFCTPSFVVGNCLLLDSSSHQYDRVYCGASCPSEHENYMKNLVRVGGILVMPLNDHLLQVTRTGEMTYDVKNVLPVSFASLVLPQPSETHAFIKLPEKHPLPLQEICRSAIRILLRINAEAENPSLKDKKKLVPTKRKRAKRRVRKVIIPVFDHQAAPERPHSSDVESVGDDPTEVRSMLEDLPPEEQEELRRLEQDCLRDQEHYMPLTSQEGELEDRLDKDSPDNEQLKELDQDITCSNGKKKFVNDNLRTLMEDDGLCPLVEDKSQKTSNDNGKRILSDDNGRLLDVDSSEACSSKKASSIDGMTRISSNNNSRRGSKSDSENSRRGSQAEASDSGRSSQGDSFNYRHWLAQRKKEVLEETNLLMSLEYISERNTEPEAMDTTDTEAVNSETVNEQRNSQPKVRGNRSDSQKILNGDSGIDNISDDSVSGESSSDPEKTEAEAGSKPLASKVSNEDALEACIAVRHASYLKRSAEDNEDELYLPTSLAAARQAGRCCQKAVIFKRIAYSDVDSDDLDDLESDSGKESFPKDLEGTREKSDLSCYTYYMTQKINMLPLPHPLKIFLNYSRPV